MALPVAPARLGGGGYYSRHVFAALCTAWHYFLVDCLLKFGRICCLLADL
jgi:hypothetical protein